MLSKVKNLFMELNDEFHNDQNNNGNGRYINGSFFNIEQVCPSQDKGENQEAHKEHSLLCKTVLSKDLGSSG